MHVYRSLAITANAVGWDHPLVATAYMNLGTVEMHRSNYNKGEDWSRKAITIYEVQILKYVRRQMKSKYKFYLNEYFGTLVSEWLKCEYFTRVCQLCQKACEIYCLTLTIVCEKDLIHTVYRAHYPPPIYTHFSSHPVTHHLYSLCSISLSQFSLTWVSVLLIVLFYLDEWVWKREKGIPPM